MLSIVIKSQTELDIFWSNDNNKDVPTKFKMCWKNAITETCASKNYWSSTPNMTIPNLQPATKYIIAIARYKENIIGHKIQEIAITRSGKNCIAKFRLALKYQKVTVIGGQCRQCFFFSVMCSSHVDKNNVNPQ